MTWAAVVVAPVAACAGRADPAPIDTPVSPQLEQRLVRETAPDRPLRIRFDWNVRERDARFGGRGVARVGPGHRARLDLFGPRGSGVLTAVLLDGELTVPATAQIEAPAPPLLWSVLGVLRPPEEAELTGTARQADDVRLDYTGPGGRWRFEFEGDRLRFAEWEPEDGARQTVELNGAGPFGVPERAVYRDYATFRELVLTLDEADEVEGFPPDIWTLGRG